LRAQLLTSSGAEADRLVVVPERVEAFEVGRVNEPVGEQAWVELVDEQFPLGEAALAVGADLDGLGVGADLGQAGRLEAAGEPATVVGVVGLRGEQRQARAGDSLVQLIRRVDDGGGGPVEVLDQQPAAGTHGRGERAEDPVALGEVLEHQAGVDEVEPPGGNVLVANTYGESIAEFARTATGNAAPLRTIAGAATGLSFPVGIDIDAVGDIYVSNQFAGVSEFSPAASGNVAPIATISGAATGLSAPGRLAVAPPLSVATKRLPRAHLHRRYRARLAGTTRR
jgi:hypothetical protein